MASTTAKSSNKWIKYCVEHATEVSFFIDSLKQGNINVGTEKCEIPEAPLEELRSFLSKQYKKLSKDTKVQVCKFISQEVKKESEEPMPKKRTEKSKEMRSKAMCAGRNEEEEIGLNPVRDAKMRGKQWLTCCYCFRYVIDRPERLKTHMQKCKAGPKEEQGAERDTFIEQSLSDVRSATVNMSKYIYVNPDEILDKNYGRKEVLEILRRYGHLEIPIEARKNGKLNKRIRTEPTQQNASHSPPGDFDGDSESYDPNRVTVVDAVPPYPEESDENWSDAIDSSSMLELTPPPKRGKNVRIVSDEEQDQDTSDVLENTPPRQQGKKRVRIVSDEKLECLPLELSASDHSSEKEVSTEEKNKPQARRGGKKKEQFKKAQKTPSKPAEIAERVDLLRVTAEKELNRIEQGKKLDRDNTALLNRYIACEVCLRQGHRPGVIHNWKMQTYCKAHSSEKNNIEFKGQKFLVVPVDYHKTFAMIVLDPRLQSFLEKYLRIVRIKIIEETASLCNSVLLQRNGEPFRRICSGIIKLQLRHGYKHPWTSGDARKSFKTFAKSLTGDQERNVLDFLCLSGNTRYRVYRHAEYALSVKPCLAEQHTTVSQQAITTKKKAQPKEGNK